MTGGSGVVGSALIRRLVAEGHEVKALARNDLAAKKVSDVGARPVHGDILDPTSVREFAMGAEVLFHVAGINEMCPAHPDLMRRVNVDGTGTVIDACRRAGVGRLVHTSSAAAIGEEAGDVGTELTEHRGRFHSYYEKTKHAAEQLVLGAGDLDRVVVNPSSVQGPGRSTGTGKLIIDVLNGRLTSLVDTTFSIVDIDDCADGHVLAAKNGLSGSRYILSAASLTIKEAIEVFAHATGRELDVRFLPAWVASAGAAMAEAAGKLTRRRPPVCREMIRVLRAGAVYDGSRASRDLGLVYTPLPETIRRTVAWFEAEGLLE